MDRFFGQRGFGIRGEPTSLTEERTMSKLADKFLTIV